MVSASMKMPLFCAVVLSWLVLCARAQTPTPTPATVDADPQRAAEVDWRGEQGMGFRHDLTSHHFHLLTDGGSIEVEANDASDGASRNAIHAHMGRIAAMFSEGDFSLPLFIHDRQPPGVDTMKRLNGKIAYQAQDTARGAQVRILTHDPIALEAVHDFLRFQITDHRTGDPLEVQGQGPKRPRPGDNLGRDAQPAFN
jgi:hypothetical protein